MVAEAIPAVALAAPPPEAPVPAPAVPAHVEPAVAPSDVTERTRENLLAATEQLEPIPAELSAPPPPLPTDADLEPERQNAPATEPGDVPTKRISNRARKAASSMDQSSPAGRDP